MDNLEHQRMFANNLKYLINAKGYSYRSLSRHSGVPFSTISSIIHGTSPTIGVAHRLSVALGKTIDQMITIDFEQAAK